MSNSKWIGAALGLALYSTALASCSVKDDRSGQPTSQEANLPKVEWTKNAENQLVQAIAQAPTNGLKPDLFLKGDLPKDDSARFAVLTKAALGYAEALAHGYSDPKKLAKDYSIPRPSAEVERGLVQAIQNGTVDQWLASLPPQTDEYRALSQAHLDYLRMAQNAKFEPVGDGEPIKPGSRDPRVPAVASALRAVGYLPSAQSGAGPETRYSSALVSAVKGL